MLPLAAVMAQAGEQHLGVAENRAEDVVEVVRDASGERAQRFQALRLAQALLESSPFPLAALAEQPIDKGLADRPQQRDVVVRPAFPADDYVKTQQANTGPGVHERNAEPGVNPAGLESRLRLARRQG